VEFQAFDFSNYYFVQNGHPVSDIFTSLHLSDEEKLSKLVILQGRPRLVGGKGGKELNKY
jgi:hypothetical protein